MRLGLIAIAALFAAVAVACGSDSAPSASPTSTPLVNIPEFERVLDDPRDDVLTPDFTLKSTTGEVVRLSDLKGDKPFAIIFYRGFF